MAMQFNLGEAIISEGSAGADVRLLQSKLTGLGYSPGPVDGIYGPYTVSAVKAFQAANGLTVDGITGPETWGVLNKVTSPPLFAPPTQPTPVVSVPPVPPLLDTLQRFWYIPAGLALLFFVKRR